MKLKINRDRLADIVARGASSAPKNSPVAMANHARIVVSKGGIAVATTNFDMMVEASGECEMERQGATTVDAAKLKATIDRLPKGVDVSMAFDDTKRELIVKAGRSRVTFPTLAAEDWPARSLKVDGAKFSLSGADIGRLFSQTVQAVSPAIASPMSGVFLHFRESEGSKSLAAVGTTGMILILAMVDAPNGCEAMPHREGHPPGVILSAETANSVLRLFRGAEKVEVEVDEGTILFTTDSVRFCSALVNGTYPNYTPLVANAAETRVYLDRESCANTVALLEPFALKEGGHRLQCAGSDEGFVVAVGSQTGGGVDVVEAEISGEVAAFGMSGQFMKTMLSSFKSECIAMHPDHKMRRVLFRSDNEPDLIGVIAMMNIPTDLAEAPKHG